MPDNLTLYRKDIDRLLAPGEEPLAMVRVRTAYGADAVPRSNAERLDRALRRSPSRIRARAVDQARGTEERSARRRPVLDALVNVITFDPSIPTPSWERIFGGVVRTGSPGSHADRLGTAINEGTGMLACVVTDRRLILVRNEVKTLTPVYELPRPVITVARRASRGPARGRVVLDFTDASSLTLRAGFVGGRSAARMARALGGVA